MFDKKLTWFTKCCSLHDRFPPAPPAVSDNSPPLVNPVRIQSISTITALTQVGSLRKQHVLNWVTVLIALHGSSEDIFIDLGPTSLRSLSSLCNPKYLADETVSESLLTFIGQRLTHFCNVVTLISFQHWRLGIKFTNRPSRSIFIKWER